jgi:hypothetical protein
MVCGKKRGTSEAGPGYKGLEAATAYAPEPRTGTWWSENQGNCTIWYHHPPDPEQRHNRHERAEREQRAH